MRECTLLPLFCRTQVFHAGTALNGQGELVSAGGRVLNVTALGKDVADAQANAYKVCVLCQPSVGVGKR